MNFRFLTVPLSNLQKIAFMVALGLVTTEHLEGELLHTGSCFLSVTDSYDKLLQ